MILVTKKCRNYAACGVSQTPIYKARLRGETFGDLSKKYGITPNCARLIYNKEKKKEDFKEGGLYDIIEELADSEQMIMKTITVLQRYNLDSKEAILNVSRKELLKYRNCGRIMADLILKVADILRETEN